MSFQNVGTCVEKSVVGVACGRWADSAACERALDRAGRREIDFTLRAWTCWMKNGLNVTVTRGCPTSSHQQAPRSS